MKITLKFENEDFEDNCQFLDLLKVAEYKAKIFDAYQICRTRLKHGEGVTEAEEQVLEELKETLWFEDV